MVVWLRTTGLWSMRTGHKVGPYTDGLSAVYYRLIVRAATCYTYLVCIAVVGSTWYVDAVRIGEAHCPHKIVRRFMTLYLFRDLVIIMIRGRILMLLMVQETSIS
jgi:hypothetical protein